MEKKKFISRLVVFVLLHIVFVLIYVNSYVIEDTNSRYIEQQKDQVYASYTALYFDSNVKSATVALENDTAYINFDLMNFIGEDVTKRDIEYVITKPSKFYDDKANEITPTGTNKIHVLDEWNQPVEVGEDTYKYNTTIVENTGEVVYKDGVPTGAYQFTYETVNVGGTTDGSSDDEVVTEKGIGKTHNVTVKIERTDKSTFSGEENVSIVIKLNSPYAEVLVINLHVLDKLITFSNSAGKIFDTDFEKLTVQSVNSYSHIKTEHGYEDRFKPNSDNIVFASYGIKVTVYFTNLIIDDNTLDQLHIQKDGQQSSNIDITKPYIIDLYTNGKSGGYITLYVPQSSSFDLYFLRTSDTYKFEVVVYTYMYNKTAKTYEYQLYDTNAGGYDHTSGKYLVENRKGA